MTDKIHISEIGHWPEGVEKELVLPADTDIIISSTPQSDKPGFFAGLAAVALGEASPSALVTESDESWEASAALHKPLVTIHEVVDMPTDKPMHGLLNCTGEGCKICNSIKVIKERDRKIELYKPGTINFTKFRSMLAEYAADLGHEPTDQDVQDLAKAIDFCNVTDQKVREAKKIQFDSATDLHKQVALKAYSDEEQPNNGKTLDEEGKPVPDGIEFGMRFTPRPSKSQVGQALANQARANRLAKRLKKKEKAARNRCKGYETP